jgi:CubicO group peptidase (beta-lactamase class C family)
MVTTQAISDLLERAADEGAVAGVVASAATSQGPIFEGAAGVRDRESGVPMTTDTVVWIASMTKALTGTCAMQLVERGKLALDEPIAHVLPELGKVQVLAGFGPEGRPRLRPARGAITLRHLLTHTSGYVYDLWNGDMSRYLEATGTAGIVSCQNAALAIPLVFDPGERWAYGIGIDWAGKAVEAVSGMRLGQYMRANLLEPLGMKDTNFGVSAAQRPRLAKVHNRTAEGLVPSDFELPAEPEFDMGGGGLYGTVGDYLRFTRMILNRGALEGTRVLGAETVASMSANAMGAVSCEAMKTASPALSRDVDFLAGMKWGLTFLINPEPLPTGRSAGSLAWAGLANSYFWIDPVRQLTGVYATQMLPFFDDRAVGLFQDFESAVYRALS